MVLRKGLLCWWPRVQELHLQRVQAHPLDNCPQVKKHTTQATLWELIPAVSLHSHGRGLILGPPPCTWGTPAGQPC